jgi:hypothetical protein
MARKGKGVARRPICRVVSEMGIFRQVQNANVARVAEVLDSEMALVWHSFDREWEGSGNTTPASTQQRINDGFDMNHGRVEKLGACVAGVAQKKWELRAR